MTRRVFLQIVLAALLLFGQQVAVTHALLHAHGSAPQHETGKGSFQPGSCDLHGVYGQILGGLPSNATCHTESFVPVEVIAVAALACAAAPSFAPLSRGPPSLL